jgi:hypothetical protein
MARRKTKRGGLVDNMTGPEIDRAMIKKRKEDFQKELKGPGEFKPEFLGKPKVVEGVGKGPAENSPPKKGARRRRKSRKQTRRKR